MATSDLVLDSDVIIDFLRHRSNTLLDTLTRYRGHMTAISVYEIEATVVQSDRQAQQFRQLVQLMPVLSMDAAAASEAAALQRILQQQGQVIGLPDTLIAGICLVQKLPLLTRNIRHYQRVPGLQVVSPADVAPSPEKPG